MQQQVGILLAFFIGFGFFSNGFSSSSEVAGRISNIDSNSLNISSSSLKKYVAKSYFEKCESFVESKFQRFVEDELLHYKCKLLSDDPSEVFRLSVSNRVLVGEGFHRHLYSSIRSNIRSESIQLPNFTSCKVIILERLPLGVFADPFELQHLLKRHVFTDVAVFGDTNLELPSVASNRSVVEAHMSISPTILAGQTNEAEISIELPLHARYPPLGEGGYTQIEFGAPDLLMLCSIEGNLSNQSCMFAPSVVDGEYNSGISLWRIPSGTRTHAGIVSVVTFFTAFVSTLVIVVTSMFFSDIHCAKTFKSS